MVDWGNCLNFDLRFQVGKLLQLIQILVMCILFTYTVYMLQYGHNGTKPYLLLFIWLINVNYIYTYVVCMVLYNYKIDGHKMFIRLLSLTYPLDIHFISIGYPLKKTIII